MQTSFPCGRTSVSCHTCTCLCKADANPRCGGWRARPRLDSFRELVAAARAAIPDVAITTDIIAGFPGETEEEFAESLAFVREMNFAGGHVFTYSPRPGTGAAKMKGQIRPEIRKKRNHILHEALEESAKAYRQKFLGQTMSVLVGVDFRNGRLGLANGRADRKLPA